ncbi:DUF1795 domain-containing protein [Paraburkholderia dipogonis]|uniref:DUF1795 domain-containing protein n=1 Tax=Paraburkholderia dipogonis TaxID=1211383 RepID=A0A4Y8N6D7_9BURK|nr:DUF1795 domain-containing protein [Paraburkholderia dipogonis]TFE45172.1 DUF1795 domain-containing protein [Paraburkholderia dipogonis]
MTVHYTMHEGRITLPAGYSDRTVNIFVQEPMTNGLSNVQVARDTARQGEALDDYVNRQIALLKRKIKGLSVTSREAVVLAGCRADGIEIETRYQSNGKSVYQRQCAVFIANDRALIFTATNTVPFTSEQLAIWRRMTDTFVPV